MFDKLAEIGLEKGQGIFFFLFIALGVLFWLLVRSIMGTNNKREERYINTIDKLAEVHDIKGAVEELRKDVNAANERQEKMLGRVLDRLPANK